MAFGPSRRDFLYAAATVSTLAAGQRPPVVPSERRRFRDPATEFDLTRLTDPEVANCWLPRSPLRAISGRANALLYASDREGTVQAWRMDLKSGESRPLTATENVDPRSVTWMPDERSVACFAGGEMRIVSDKRFRTVYVPESGWEHSEPFTLSSDGNWAAAVEKREGRYRLRVIGIGRRSAHTVFEAPEPVRYVRFRPGRSALLYNHAGTLWTVNPDGGSIQRLRALPGEAGDAQWSADGKLLHYLVTPAEGSRTIQMREIVIESGQDRLLGLTTQFVSFARNADSTVFAGVSGSRGAPYILLLLRTARRELTVAEHKASDSSKAVVIFAPDSQRLYYETDREGRSAIYSMGLERFLEKTDESASLLHPA